MNKTEDKIYYTYLFLDPRKELEPYYVGMGIKNRCNRPHRNIFCNRVTTKIKEVGMEPFITQCDIALTLEEAYEWEVMMIAKFGRRCNKSGCLTNISTGGRGGTIGVSPSKETRAKIGAVWRGRKHSKETIEKMSKIKTGLRHSEITKAKISSSKKGMIPWNKDKIGLCSEETRAKMRESRKGNKPMLGKIHSEEAKTKMSSAQKGKKHSEETKAKISESVKGNKNPFYGRKHTDETKAKMKAARKNKK